jgi:hypothetical protein
MGLAPQGPHEAQRRRWTFYEAIKDRQMIIAQFGVFIFISAYEPILEHIF